MAQEQNYQINYTINVDASKGTEQIRDFADSVAKLTQAKTSLTPAVTNIKGMMDEIDAVFRPNGKKRDYNYAIHIETTKTEEKLNRVKSLISEIKEMSKGISLIVNPGQKLETKAVKSNAAKIIKNQQTQNAAIQQNATNSVSSVQQLQQLITRTVGKINAAMISLEKGREINIKTDKAKRKLDAILSQLRQIRSASQGITLGIHGGAPGAVQAAMNRAPVPYAPGFGRTFQLPPGVNPLGTQPGTTPSGKQTTTSATNQQAKIGAAIATQAINAQRKNTSVNNTIYGNRRRAAINRLQYSRPPTMRSVMPYAYMLNGYMLFSVMRSELTKAVEYANIMESARSILKVADTDLATFENRFTAMAQKVRTVGVETKFTAVEVAGAVKFLAMAGQGIETINKSIRPIADLALIGDNNLSQIADLTTNIMAGYNIRPESMSTVADIIASTISRSNVNIIETAEAFKMSAGFMQMAGVDFSEASAAIGLLGNMGVKGTMAGTSMRAMATRFASQPREAKKVLERLGVDITHYVNIYGKQVEKLRPLADIFEDLSKAGATMGDMHKIFGKIGGNAGMMFLRNYDKLRSLAAENRVSHGISGELAKVKQETTKGLWYQVTSQLSETFMQGFEIMEPKIQRMLRDFLAKFKAPEFARGLASLASALLDIFSVLGKIALWFGKNFTWLEPIIFTGLVATRLFKIAGAITNVGVALGFLGKQSLANSAIRSITSLVGFGGKGAAKSLSFASKRAIVSTLQAAGISGKGAYAKILAQAGIIGSASQVVGSGAASGLFASQVATGKGLIGAGASIGALGTTAVAATAAVAALVGALGWVAYKTWKIKEAKDAMVEEVENNKKYRFSSIEDLYEALDKTYNKAKMTRQALDDLKDPEPLKDVTGHSIGWFTGNWWKALGSGVLWALTPPQYKGAKPSYTFRQARLDNLTSSLETYADMNVQEMLNSAWIDIGKMSDPIEVAAYIQNIREKYTIPENAIDSTLFRIRRDGAIKYNQNGRNMTTDEARTTVPYRNYLNANLPGHIEVGATAYLKAIESVEGASNVLERVGFNFSELEEMGFYRDENNMWTQRELPKNATDSQRVDANANFMKLRDELIAITSVIKKEFGGSAEAAENIMKRAGFSALLFANEPQKDDAEPFNTNNITAGGDGPDDGLSGGNYSGTGKLSSAAPKQVIVNITNLLSIQTIDLLKSPEGNQVEIQNLKEMLAQALIDTVHDFDASWNS